MDHYSLSCPSTMIGVDESDEEEVIRHERIYTIDSFYKVRNLLDGFLV